MSASDLEAVFSQAERAAFPGRDVPDFAPVGMGGDYFPPFPYQRLDRPVMPTNEGIDQAFTAVEGPMTRMRTAALESVEEEQLPEAESLGIFAGTGAVKVRPAEHPGAATAAPGVAPAVAAAPDPDDQEIAVLGKVVKLLASLPPDARKRAERYLGDRFGR